MENFYSNEPDILELVSLIKAHGIKTAVVSPGSTNISFAACLLYDKDINVYSAVDERSAAYMACGLAEELGEPVIISCTGATASRNYVPALTEAFYRKLPILAITSSQPFGRVGQHIPQVTDRNKQMNDIIKKSVQLSLTNTDEERWSNNVKINDALLELKRYGGGPVHINIETSFSKVFNQRILPEARKISRLTLNDRFPDVPMGKVAIFVGSHSKFTKELTVAVDSFCSKYNAIVICDHTSNYKGNYRVLGGLIERQKGYYAKCRETSLIIHIGEVSGAYYTFESGIVWRVNPDGEIRDTFRRLSTVFQMNELDFFNMYNRRISSTESQNTYFNEWKEEEKRVVKFLPELPFSNCWVAQQTAGELPKNSEIHFGILNSLRMWNLFEIPASVNGYSNVGGFGIDGCISTLIGASLVHSDKLYFGVVGDLATFYDLNSLGNRHIGNNVRILVINNGTGFEMRHHDNRGDVFGDDADILFAAAGHFGNKSKQILKHISEDFGFEYMAAVDKKTYFQQLSHFTTPDSLKRPILFEVFVDAKDEYESYHTTQYLIQTTSNIAKKAVKSILGEGGTQKLKGLLKR